ncbi:MAG: LCP family protein [Anaerolineae bacterium]|nr:LCP family protein [Anaerolineae bacterium]
MLDQSNLLDTQPVRPVVPPRSRRWGCGWILFGMVMTPVFLCGLTLVFYLLFPPARANILVLGVDGRGGEGYVSRTDSIMLLGIYPAQLRASLLSIPRDLFIDVPNYGIERINTVNMLGEMEGEGNGPALLASALQQTFNVTVDRYVRLDFQGFVELINAVGGVTIDVERAIVDDAYPTEDGGVISIRFDPGLQQMDGERALIYARTRHGDDDYQRAARQQQVLSGLLSRLVNPLRWPAALSVLNRYTDTNLTLWDMLTLAPPVVLNRGRFEQLVIDRDYIAGTAEGYAVPNLDAIAPWLEGRFK